MQSVSTLFGFAAVALAGGCMMNHSGNVSAPPGGDVSNQAERGSPVEELRAACGEGAATTAGAVISRQPYLQQVTTSSAMIGWVSDSPDGEHVNVTLPDGSPVMVAAAAIDDSALRVAAWRQMWVTVDGLEPDTIYCYEVANGNLLQTRTGFRTAPASDDPAPVRFLAFGDSGGGSDQRTLLDQMYDYPYDLMIHTGDIAYNSGQLFEFEENVFGVYQDLLRNIPLFPVAGNHDYHTQNGAAFRSVFALPGDSGEKSYSYDWGRVHFVALDTEVSYATLAEWLDADLTATSAPWKIVYLHRPPYSTGDHGSDTSLRNKLAPIFEKHGVQLVLAGHDHDYERMIPQNGVAYFVTGGGGRGTRPVGTSSFTAFSAEVIHFLYGEVLEDKMIIHAVDGTGTEFDSLVIAR